MQRGESNGVEEKDASAWRQTALQHPLQKRWMVWLVADVSADDNVELLLVVKARVSARARLSVRSSRVLVPPVPTMV